MKVKLGFLFGPTLRFIGAIMMLGGVLLFIYSYLASMVFLLIGAFLSTTKNHILFDRAKGRYKVYTNYLGLKIGQWESLETFVDVAVLGGQEGYILHSRTNQMHKDVNKVVRVFLLSKSHRTKLLVGTFQKAQDAEQRALALEEYLGVRYTHYAPEISRATQLKKSRRK